MASSSWASFLDDFTTQYYDMQDDSGDAVSMPLMCAKKDRYALAYFRSWDGVGSFDSYVTAEGFKTRAAAVAAGRSSNQPYEVYKLSAVRR